MNTFVVLGVFYSRVGFLSILLGRFRSGARTSSSSSFELRIYSAQFGGNRPGNLHSTVTFSSSLSANFALQGTSFEAYIVLKKKARAEIKILAGSLRNKENSLSGNLNTIDAILVSYYLLSPIFISPNPRSEGKLGN